MGRNINEDEEKIYIYEKTGKSEEENGQKEKHLSDYVV